MARAGTVLTSLPEAGVDDGVTEEELAEQSPEEIEDDAQAAEDAEWERQARAQGWRPLAEFRGRPGDWVDAKTFVDRGRDFVPFVKKENAELKAREQRTAQEMAALREELGKTQRDMQQLLDYSRRADQAGYDRAVRDLKARQREAAAAGDVATFDEVGEQLTQMQEARESIRQPAPEPAPSPQPQPQVNLVKPEIEEFLADNPWFTSDRVLNAAMVEEHTRIIRESPGLSLREQLERAKEAVVAEFPKKFGRAEAPAQPPRPRQPQAPLGPTAPARQPGRAARGGIDSIADPTERAEARYGLERARRSTPNITEEEYMRIYNNPHDDVLQVMDESKTSRRTRPNGR
jgi:hypothetical protein